MERRQFLKVVCYSAGGVALSPLQAGCGGGGASGPIAAGNVKDVPAGYLDFVVGQPLLLGRDTAGLYAMTAICNHAGCDMNGNGTISSHQVLCTCHGSLFDQNGAVIRGPAGSPLDHYQVDLAKDGTITVQASTVVAASVRTPVS